MAPVFEVGRFGMARSVSTWDHLRVRLGEPAAGEKQDADRCGRRGVFAGLASATVFAGQDGVPQRRDLASQLLASP